MKVSNINERNIKVLLTNIGLDTHDRGIQYVAQILRDSGMEVIYLGFYQTAQSIVRAAIEEDVDVIGISNLSGAHRLYTSEVQQLLREFGRGDICLVAGGLIKPEDKAYLENQGITGNFGPGTPAKVIIDHIRERVMTKWKSEKHVLEAEQRLNK